jgi:anti-sigma regulatory factor (Ser/Thr protein kinase)
VSTTSDTAPEALTAFRHEALLYHGPHEFASILLPLIRRGIDDGDAILVALDTDKSALLRAELGGDASAVRFVDMREVGRNPARIIPVWQSFVARYAASGRGSFGVGEPVWPGRSPDELQECDLHESLLNVAFSAGPAWRLVCPYDVVNLREGEIRTAFDTHPLVPGFPSRADPRRLGGVPERFRAPLTEPEERPYETTFEAAGSLARLRALVTARALEAGLSRNRAGDMALAVSEVAANSIRHGGGGGTLRIWHVRDTLVCEVRDRGRIDDPLVGRVAPQPIADGQRGLWLVNQLCDLVQLRSLDEGVVVRLHAASVATRVA